jgi:hypothetical protein
MEFEKEKKGDGSNQIVFFLCIVVIVVVGKCISSCVLCFYLCCAIVARIVNIFLELLVNIYKNQMCFQLLF